MGVLPFYQQVIFSVDFSKMKNQTDPYQLHFFSTSQLSDMLFLFKSVRVLQLNLTLHVLPIFSGDFVLEMQTLGTYIPVRLY